jgi:MFS family permease
MVFRFSLYGFLKNQRYFEPFLLLVFREKGLSFFVIGLLVAFREACINVMEIPSGAVADLYGRRRSMIFSFTAYVASFAAFALSAHLWVLFAAMFLFAVGEAFRTGTHKAMIFDWLQSEGRENERTKVYGYTRSWSKIGSAVSVVIAAAIVLIQGAYASIFWYSIIPYAAGIVNFLGYPAFLDGERKNVKVREVFDHLLRNLRESVRNSRLRRLLLESMTHDGLYGTVKDYLQPLLKQSALLIPIFVSLSDTKRAAILVGAVYFVLHLLESMSSRSAHRLCDRAGDEARAGRCVWWGELVIYAAAVLFFLYDIQTGAIAAFVALAVCHNLWRPVFLSRMDTTSDPKSAATILSVDSQAKSFFTMLAAPLLGAAVDAFGLWTVGALGVMAVVPILATSRRE